MKRFYYEFREMTDDTWEYCVFDRRRGSEDYVALTNNSADAELIVNALNAILPPPDAGVFA